MFASVMSVQCVGSSHHQNFAVASFLLRIDRQGLEPIRAPGSFVLSIQAARVEAASKLSR